MKIAIIDTGINEKHIAFKNNFKISQCICIRKNVDERYFISEDVEDYEYYGAAEPPVRCGESRLSGLTESLHFVY